MFFVLHFEERRERVMKRGWGGYEEGVVMKRCGVVMKRCGVVMKRWGGYEEMWGGYEEMWWWI